MTKYSKTYSPTVLCYARKYSYMLKDNLRDLDTLSEAIRNQTIKALIILAKFLGIHEEFKNKLKSYGIKSTKPDVFASFMRIYNNNSSDLTKWYSEAMSILRDNEKLLLRFLCQTGVRKEEGITSFNKIVELSKENKLSEYFNEELSILEHFRFKELFLRNTKNVYVSILPKSMVMDIANSQTVSYQAIIKRLKRKNVKCKINLLRDYFGTYLIRHNLIQQEIDLLQGRIPPSIFLRNYWSPSFKELRDRVIEATDKLEASISI